MTASHNGNGNSNHSPATASQSQQDVAEQQEMDALVPGFWHGSSRFLVRVTLWLLYTGVIPTITATWTSSSAKARSPSPHQTIDDYAWYLLPITGIAYLLWHLLPLAYSRPPAPADRRPFVTSDASNDDIKPVTQVQVKHVLIVCNLHTGRGRKRVSHELDTIVLPMLNANSVTYEIKHTEYAQHARVIAQDTDLRAYDAIMCCGGDGTFSEIVNGMLRRSDHQRLPISLCPVGSGNSLSADLGTWDVKEAVQRMLQGTVHWMDVNELSDSQRLLRYSTNTIALGTVGDAAVLAEHYRWLGQTRYDVMAVWLIMKMLPHYFVTMVDKQRKIEGSVNVLFINATQHFGKGLRSAPFAKLNDHKMDVVYLMGASRMEMLRLFLLFPQGQHASHHKVTSIQCQTLTIREPDVSRYVINVDGDNVLYTKELKIRCIPDAVQIFAPADCTGRDW